jgi:hypothetical protein
MVSTSVELTIYHLNTSMTYMTFFLLYMFFRTPTLSSIGLYGFLTGLMICNTIAYGFYGLVYDSYSIEYDVNLSSVSKKITSDKKPISAILNWMTGEEDTSPEETPEEETVRDYTITEQLLSILAVFIILGGIGYLVYTRF